MMKEKGKKLPFHPGQNGGYRKPVWPSCGQCQLFSSLPLIISRARVSSVLESIYPPPDCHPLSSSVSIVCNAVAHPNLPALILPVSLSLHPASGSQTAPAPPPTDCVVSRLFLTRRDGYRDGCSVGSSLCARSLSLSLLRSG